MSAVETLQTAIDTLKRLKAASDDDPTPAKWNLGGHYGFGIDIVSRYDEDQKDAEVVAERVYPPDAELIVTLHRTIDVQLAFLRAARSDLTTERIRETDATHAIALATAINGGAK